jgi:hypothetical protein
MKFPFLRTLVSIWLSRKGRAISEIFDPSKHTLSLLYDKVLRRPVETTPDKRTSSEPVGMSQNVPISEVNALIRSPRQRELAAKAEW